MTRRWSWSIRRDCTCGCKCPTVYECPTCQTKVPAAKGISSLNLRCACDEAHEAMQRAQKEAGERYWREIGPVIETWDMAIPGEDD